MFSKTMFFSVNDTKSIAVGTTAKAVHIAITWKTRSSKEGCSTESTEKYFLDQLEAFSHGCMVVISFPFLLQSLDFYWEFGLFFWQRKLYSFCRELLVSLNAKSEVNISLEIFLTIIYIINI